jgi:hypothetical protein
VRKRFINTSPEVVRSAREGWLDLERIASVELTSEEQNYPIESALSLGETRGWRAGTAGPQTIRLLFDQPQSLGRIELTFVEEETKRTQEFVLRWSSDGTSFREIVRQQFNFSPPDTTRENEEFRVEIADATALELIIVPNLNGETARASLRSLRAACGTGTCIGDA